MIMCKTVEHWVRVSCGQLNFRVRKVRCAKEFGAKSDTDTSVTSKSAL